MWCGVAQRVLKSTHAGLVEPEKVAVAGSMLIQGELKLTII